MVVLEGNSILRSAENALSNHGLPKRSDSAQFSLSFGSRVTQLWPLFTQAGDVDQSAVVAYPENLQDHHFDLYHAGLGEVRRV